MATSFSLAIGQAQPPEPVYLLGVILSRRLVALPSVIIFIYSFEAETGFLCSHASSFICPHFGQNSEISTASVDEERDSQNNGMVTKNFCIDSIFIRISKKGNFFVLVK